MLKQPIAYSFVTEKQVGSNGEMRTEYDLLVYRVDPEVDRLMRCGKRNRLAFPIDISTGPQVDASK